ncbi:hypothetical protein ACG9VU_001176 [Vibrio alginolyticus]
MKVYGQKTIEVVVDRYCDICESCFQVALSALKEHRRSIVMFDDEQDLPDEKFGQQPVAQISQNQKCPKLR